MAKNNKISMKQLRYATDVLMRFLEKYQTVNPQKSNAIVEYEGKLELIADCCSSKHQEICNPRFILRGRFAQSKNRIRRIEIP